MESTHFDLSELSFTNLFARWQRDLHQAIDAFLAQVKEAHLNNLGTDGLVPSILISYAPASESGLGGIDTATDLTRTFEAAGFVATPVGLSTSVALAADLEKCAFMVVLCTPAYADMVSRDSDLRAVLQAFGQRTPNSLQALLCAGSFDTAFQIVDKNYLVRDYSAVLENYGYHFCLMPADEMLKPGQIYLKAEDGALGYRVMKGKHKVGGVLFSNDVPGLGTALSRAPLSLTHLAPFFNTILAHGTQAGHLRIDSLVSLNTFVDVFLLPSGRQGLGLLPDILGLKAVGRSSLEQAYETSLETFLAAQTRLTTDYRLSHALETEIGLNPYVKSLERQSLPQVMQNTVPGFEPLLQSFLSPQSSAKISLLLCATNADVELSHLALSQTLSQQKVRVLSLNCAQYAGQSAKDCVRLALQKLKLSQGVLRTASIPMVLLLKGYQNLGAYDNLYAQNNLSAWPMLKVLVTCRADFFKARGYLSCFLRQGSERQIDDLVVYRIAPFASIETQKTSLRRGLSFPELRDKPKRVVHLVQFPNEPEVFPALVQRDTGFELHIERSGEIVSKPCPLELAPNLSLSTFFETHRDYSPLSLAFDHPVIEAIRSAENTDTVESLLPKPRAFRSELRAFLFHLKQQTWPVNLTNQPQVFISYAWEPAGLSRIRQQAHLLGLAEDLRTLGFRPWLDLEQMSGNIDQQMAGNIKGSRFVLVIGSPLYAERATTLDHNQQKTNVQKEYEAILEQQQSGQLQVFPLQFLGESAFPPALLNHANQLDFRDIEDTAQYLFRMTDPHHGLVPKLLNLTADAYAESVYHSAYTQLQNQLALLIGKHLIVDTNQSSLQALDVEHRLKDYLPAFGLHDEQSPLESRFNLRAHLETFLVNPQAKTVVVLGCAGSGKSLFALQTFKLYQDAWQDYRNYSGPLPSFLPIYIPLRAYGQQPEHCLSEALKQHYALNDLDIEALRQGLEQDQQILFIADGYDELGAGNRPNVSQQLADWPHAKLLVISRPELFDLEHSVKQSLAPVVGTLEVVYVSPFVPEEIKKYIQEHEGSTKDAKTYQTLQGLPGMMSILDNPFLLTLVLQSLPELLKLYKSVEAITRSNIYQAFMQTWFLQETQGRELSVEDCHHFSEALAFELFKAGTHSPSPLYPELWTFFENEATLASREAAPLRYSGSECTFIHKSLAEYGAARYLWKAIQRDTADFSLVWNVRSLTEEPGILRFLEEFYRAVRIEQPALEERLLSLVYASREYPKFAIAAGNALTLFNYAEVALSGRDFSGIRVQDADLRGSIAHRTDFRGAHFKGVYWQGACLADASFENATLEALDFEEAPSISLSGWARSVCYSPNGTYFAVAVDKFIEIYETLHARRVQVLKAHHGAVMGLAFNPRKPRQLVSVSTDKTLCLWDIEKGQLEQRLQAKHPLLSVAFSPTGLHIAAGHSEKGSLDVWELPSGKLLHTLSDGAQEVMALSFSPNAKILAAAHDSVICLWEVQAGRLFKRLTAHNKKVICLAFNPVSEQLASGGWDKMLRLWNIEDGTLLHNLEGHSDELTTLVFSVNGRHLASASSDGSIRLWDPKEACLERIFMANNGIVCLALRPDDQYLVSVNGDKQTLEFWSLAQKQSYRKLIEHVDKVSSLVFDPKNKLFVSASWDRSIKVWDLQQKSLLKTLERGHSHYIETLAINHPSQLVASGSYDCSIRLWDISSGLLQTIEKAHDRRVLRLAFNQEGSLLVSATNNCIKFWAVQDKTLKLQHTLAQVSSGFCLSPEGDFLVVTAEKGLKSWALKPDVVESPLAGSQYLHLGDVSSDPRGRLLAFSNVGNIFLGAAQGGLYAVLEGHTYHIQALSFSPDGRWLASVAKDARIQIWDLESGLLAQALAKEALVESAEVPGPSIPVYEDSDCLMKTDAGVEAFCWGQKNPAGYYEMASAHVDHSIRFWHLDLRAHKPQLMLVWNNAQRRLSAAATNIKGVAGLSVPNRDLLRQYGAQGRTAEETYYPDTPREDEDTPMLPHLSLIEAELRQTTLNETSIHLYLEAHRYCLTGRGSEAIALLETVKQAGYMPASVLLYVLYRGGFGNQRQDPAKTEVLVLDIRSQEAFFRKNAEQGQAEAQYLLARILHEVAMDRNLRAAHHWALMSAKQGHALAQNLVGYDYNSGVGVEKNSQKALFWYQRAAEQGYAGAQINLAFNYRDGNGVVKDKKKAFDWMLKAAEQGNPQAQYNMGTYYEEGYGAPVNLEQAFQYHLKAAIQGHQTSQTKVGHCYKNGTGVEVDPDQADYWYDQADQQGVDDLIYMLKGDVKDDDTGSNAWYYAVLVERQKQDVFLGALNNDTIHFEDYGVIVGSGGEGPQAVKTRCSEQAHAIFNEKRSKQVIADYEQALKYDEGQGTLRDPREASLYYRKAARRGHAGAQLNLGVMYALGEGIEQDDVQAVHWYQQSALQGEIYAAYNLGFMFQEGLGIDQSNGQAIVWFSKAKEQVEREPSNPEILVKLHLNLAILYDQLAMHHNDSQTNTRLSADHYAKAQACSTTFKAGLYSYWKGLTKNSSLKGKAASEYRLGILYLKGLGVEENTEKAMEHFEQALQLGYSDAGRKLSELRKIVPEFIRDPLISHEVGNTTDLMVQSDIQTNERPLLVPVQLPEVSHVLLSKTGNPKKEQEDAGKNEKVSEMLGMNLDHSPVEKEDAGMRSTIRKPITPGYLKTTKATALKISSGVRRQTFLPMSQTRSSNVSRVGILASTTGVFATSTTVNPIHAGRQSSVRRTQTVLGRIDSNSSSSMSSQELQVQQPGSSVVRAPANKRTSTALTPAYTATVRKTTAQGEITSTTKRSGTMTPSAALKKT
jgi:WD40 repeat protein/TPR repeat protein